MFWVLKRFNFFLHFVLSFFLSCCLLHVCLSIFSLFLSVYASLLSFSVFSCFLTSVFFLAACLYLTSIQVCACINMMRLNMRACHILLTRAFFHPVQSTIMNNISSGTKCRVICSWKCKAFSSGACFHFANKQEKYMEYEALIMVDNESTSSVSPAHTVYL